MDIELIEPELIEPPSTELTVPERAALALNASKTEADLRALAIKNASITQVIDKDGRQQAHGAAMELRTARTDIEKASKAARDDATKFSKAVIQEEKRLIGIIEPEELRLLSLRDAWDAIAAAEKAERERIERDKAAALQSAIDWIKDHAFAAHSQDSAAIAILMNELTAMDITLEQYGERTGEAELARMTTLERMGSLHAAAVAMEARAEELRLEREAFEAQRAEQARIEQEAASARAQAEAQAQAGRDAERAELDRQRAELAAQREAVEAAARAEAERIAAVTRAAERKADEERREADRKAQAERDEAERVAAEARAHADREAARERAEQERAAQALRDLQAAATQRLHDAAEYMLQTLQGVRMDAGFASLSEATRVSVKTAIELAGE